MHAPDRERTESVPTYHTVLPGAMPAFLMQHQNFNTQ
jgi:hypothetical protein